MPEFQSSNCEKDHLKKEQTMPVSADIGFPLSSSFVSDWGFDGFKTKFCGSENQIKISKWIKIDEKPLIGNNAHIIPFPKNLCSAKCIAIALAQELCK